MEEQYYDAVITGNMKSLLPDSYKGKAPTLWDELHNLYPAPASILKIVDDLKFVRNWPSCSVYQRFVCACDNCVKLLDEDVTYFHATIMNEMDLDSKSPAPTKYPVLPCFEIEQYMNTATCIVVRATHAYEDDIFADFGPETSKFTSLQLLKTTAFAYEHEKSEDAKWVKRQQLTPTRLFFLP